MIAAIYARKSTDQSGVADEQRSVARQIEHARQYAAAKGWTVADAYVYVDDGISGAEFANRPGFLRLMNALKPRAPFQVLIMSEESRLGREQLEVGYALKQIIQAGVRVFFYLEDRERTLNSPTDKIMLALTAFADELEREKARQRTSDAMLRKAKAGHVTGGRVFGYDNHDVIGSDGKRSHVSRQINAPEAAVIRRMFELCAAGHGVRSIAKTLNADSAPAPRPQRGRPAGWASSSVHEALRRPLYRGQIVWNQTRKRDAWGRHHQQPRDASEWIRIDAPDLRIVPETLWLAAHKRLDGAREDYIKATGGRVWGRAINGTDSPYLLTGLAQCAVCGGGLFVQTRAHGRKRAPFYVCSSFHHRGASVCGNSQALPMARIDASALDAARKDLLHPLVIKRTFEKLRSRLEARPSVSADRRAHLTSEADRLRLELSRLSAALASGDVLPSVVDAIRERERRREAIVAQMATLDEGASDHAIDQLDAAWPEIQARIRDWRRMLSEGTSRARQMLREVLDGRIVFTPRSDRQEVEMSGQTDYGRLFASVIDLSSQALASPTGHPDTYAPVELFWFPAA